MKRLLLCGIFTPLLMWATADLACATTMFISDTTLVQRWVLGQPDPGGVSPNGWFDIVGSDPAFETTGVEVTWHADDVTLSLFTSFPQGGIEFGHSSVPSTDPLYRVADLAIDLDRNGTWETGVALSHHSGPAPAEPGSGYADPPGASLLADSFLEGGIYSVVDWFSSNDIHFFTSSLGGRYDANNPKIPPVWMRLGSKIGDGSVGWTALGNPTAYRVDITLPGVNGNGAWDEFDLLWGTATCANDTVAATAMVPEPGTVLLLGSGLLSLIGFNRRKKK